MLKDRRILVEQEIKKTQETAAEMYLNIVVNDGDVHSDEYQLLKNRIMNLNFDLNMINQLIDKGHE